MMPRIKLYGAKRCHKTQYYKVYLEDLDFKCLDAELNNAFAEELRNLYESRKLNFPRITIGEKTLRNPSDTDLKKWIEKSIN